MIQSFKNILDALNGLYARRDGAHTALIFLLLLVISLTLSSCVYDNRGECEYPLRLHFTYLYNRENRDLFADEVDIVTLSLYDAESGEFVKTVRITLSDLDEEGVYTWRVPPGRFSLVSWGGAKVRHRVENQSNISDHTIALHAQCVEQMREHLWHNLTTDILVNGTVTPVYEIDLHKLTNDLLVRIHSSRDENAYRAESTIKITNGRYDAFGKQAPLAPTLYLPEIKGIAEEDKDDYGPLASHYYTLLSLVRNDDSHMMITIPGIETPIYSGELSNLLALKPGVDLDLDDEWWLDFWLDGAPDGNISVAISVNDWHVSDYTVILR